VLSLGAEQDFQSFIRNIGGNHCFVHLVEFRHPHGNRFALATHPEMRHKSMFVIASLMLALLAPPFFADPPALANDRLYAIR